MNSFEKLLEIANREEHEKLRVNEYLELTNEQNTLQTSIQGYHEQISKQNSLLKNLHSEIVCLTFEVDILKKQEKIVHNELHNLVRSVVIIEDQINSLQMNFWEGLSDFVDSCYENVKLSEVDNTASDKTSEAEIKRLREMQQFKLEGEVEAYHLYQSYQTMKIQELQYIKDVLTSKSLV